MPKLLVHVEHLSRHFRFLPVHSDLLFINEIPGSGGKFKSK